MADAWARMTGKVGVVLVTGGPGHANAISALYTAKCGEMPVVLLSGHAPLRELGLGSFQEMRQAEMAAPVTKASWTAQSTATLPKTLPALFASRNRGGRARFISACRQTCWRPNSAEAAPARRSSPRSRSHWRRRRRSAIVREIASAKRPLVVASPSARHAPGTKAGRRAAAGFGCARGGDGESARHQRSGPGSYRRHPCRMRSDRACSAKRWTSLCALAKRRPWQRNAAGS